MAAKKAAERDPE